MIMVRFCGTTEFAPGIWAGVELDTADGRNDGIVKGMRCSNIMFLMSVSNEMSPRYFHCDHNHGIFVSPNKVAKAGAEYKPRPEGEAAKRLPYKPVVNHGKVTTLGYILYIRYLPGYCHTLLRTKWCWIA